MRAMGGLTVSSSETSPSLAAIVAEVDPDASEYRRQTSPEGMVTIVFTDIAGSTVMLEELGEEAWLELMHRHNRLVRECVAEHGGEVVGARGDGFMLTFASATAALSFAIELQRGFDRHNADHPHQRLRVRIGVHTGNIYPAQEDFLGRAVILAARITGRASGGEILVSSASRAYTERGGHWRYRNSAEIELKGLTAVERVYALDW
jgi:class 3 adenylate cyclase